MLVLLGVDVVEPGLEGREPRAELSAAVWAVWVVEHVSKVAFEWGDQTQ